MPVPQELLDLAPTRLPNHRARRFDGVGYEVPLPRFIPTTGLSWPATTPPWTASPGRPHG
ncbi:hypothetical protein J0H58_09840 [bacterium]|nr:hypothetical protein [bacterium]